jgi:hypothetical protein
MAPSSLYVRCWGQSGKHLLPMSFSAFDPKRHIATANYHNAIALFDHLVGGGEQRLWNIEAERFGGFEIDY